MNKLIEKVSDLKFNTLITIGFIENNSDLSELLSSEIKLPFTILYTLEKENKLNDYTKELLLEIFENIILTKVSLVEQYKKLAKSFNIEISEVKKTTQITNVLTINDKHIDKKLIQPRRYGRIKVLKDIELSGGKPTSAQRASLQNNKLKNIYTLIDRRLIKKMLKNDETLSDDDCRKIGSAIVTFERQINQIIKK